MATSGLSPVSLSLKSRPLFSGMPNAANEPGATIVMSVSVSRVRSRCSGNRSTKCAPVPAFEKSPGGFDVAPTAATPGSVAIRDMIRLKNTLLSSRERTPVALMTSTFSG